MRIMAHDLHNEQWSKPQKLYIPEIMSAENQNFYGSDNFIKINFEIFVTL